MTDSYRPLLVVVFAIGLFGCSLGLVAASDTIGVIEFEPDSTAVDPGETVELSVVLESDGAHGGAGLYQVSTRLDYPASHLEVVAFQPGPWLQQDGDVDVVTETYVDDEEGVARLDQRIRNPDDGVTGRAPIATVTVRVEEGVDPSTVHVVADQSGGTVAVTGNPYAIDAQRATLSVDGGGDRVEPEVDPDFEFEGTPVSTSTVAATATPTATPAPTGTPTPTETPTESAGGTDADGRLSTVGTLLAGLLAVLAIRRRGRQ